LRIETTALDTRGSRDEPCEWLSLAEGDLLATAEYQRRGAAPYVVVGAAAVASTLILGLGYDEWRLGALSGAISATTGGLQIWLQPRGAVEAVDRYRRGDLLPARSAPRWVPVDEGAGVSLRWAF
jgi:hypothetical protein